MKRSLENFFFLPIMIGNFIKQKFGSKLKGKIIYLLAYLVFSAVVTVLFHRIEQWMIGEIITDFIRFYFMVGMFYVLVFLWS
ncbi:hypothetical protein [Priestia endophytica]|uniref:hypothetical protein n=1 Tax=Priestia endophytica TaxID=135735 RepID=UPI00203ECDCA|nr:hypothetical protein [Priestia endophytica]MCM3540723.1 hypothetical protein [Priestia endophytica]